MREHTDDTFVHLRQSQDLLAALGLGDRFTLAQLQARIERRRDRPVNLIARDLPTLAPHGLWVAGEHADYVFYAANSSPVRQRLIIGHEYGHMLFDDVTPTAWERIAALLMPTIDPSVPDFLARSGYDEPAERRAEVFGTVVAQRAESWSSPPPALPADPETSARLVATLEGRGRW